MTLVCPCQHVGKPNAEATFAVISTILFFPRTYLLVYYCFEHVTRGEVCAVEVDVEYRIGVPLCFKLLNGKTFEQFFASKKIVLQR